MHQASYDGFLIFYTDAPRDRHLAEDGEVPDRQNIADQGSFSNHQFSPIKLPMKRDSPSSQEERRRSSPMMDGSKKNQDMGQRGQEDSPGRKI
jgi:hypothetical protein